jgi:hypothetical protein
LKKYKTNFINGGSKIMAKLLENKKLIEDFKKEYGMIYEDAEVISEVFKNKGQGITPSKQGITDKAQIAAQKKYVAAKVAAKKAYDKAIEAAKKAYVASKGAASKAGKVVVANKGKAAAAATVAGLAGYGAYRYAKSKRAKGANESEIIDTMISVLQEGVELCESSKNPEKCKKVLESKIAKLKARK